MRIVYIITLPDVGGAQTHLLEIATYMKCRGHDVHVVVGQGGWLTEQLQSCDIPVVVVNELIREISIRQDYLAIRHVQRIIREFKPDIVHCHSSKAGIVGRIAAFIEGVPSIFTAHGWAFTEGIPFFKRVLYSLIERVMLNFTVYVLCVSKYDKALAEKWFLSKSPKLLAVHNGIEDVGKPLISDFGHDKFERHLNLIMVGRFAVPKEQMQLIKAVEKINKEYPNSIFLTLVGDGELFEAAEQYVNTHGLRNVISLLGERIDINELLVQNDVFCLISNYEGLPISIIEAMRAGLPVIASDVGGNNELVKDGLNGFLVERGNSEQLVERISFLLEHKEILRELGQKSREFYLKEFSAEQMMKRISAVYARVINKKTAAGCGC